MARRIREVTIPKDSPDNRDAGKLFVLTEMPATQAEKWAAKAFLGMARGGIDIPDDIKSMGMAGIARLTIGAFGNLRFEDAEPLLDEMFSSCVAFVPDPSNRSTYRGARIAELPGYLGKLMEEDIEEVSTRVKLRTEVFDLHLGFFVSAARSILSSAATAGAASQAT